MKNNERIVSEWYFKNLKISDDEAMRSARTLMNKPIICKNEIVGKVLDADYDNNKKCIKIYAELNIKLQKLGNIFSSLELIEG